MTYVLEAIIAREVPTELVSSIVGLKIVTLRQGIFMMPLSDKIYEANNLKSTDDDFVKLSPKVVGLAEKLSKLGPVAYIQAEYFGGMGEQAAVVWKDGQVILSLSQAQDAINQALRLLGVESQGYIDEFEAVGLGQHRFTEGWE